uniref:Uncharacterized protein n=1 Tax=Sphaerodactylus townsendi TaxID=933632 RepID=A0ACB8E9X7_9SAUR
MPICPSLLLAPCPSNSLSRSVLALLQNVLAKALYDNVAESPDELSFRKGDIMTVLERNTQGLEGWWLCSLHGRQGIVPGNRLKILVGMYNKKQLPGTIQGSPQPSQQQQQQQPPPAPVGQSPLTYPHQGGYLPASPASQYTSMHSSYLPQEDSVYLVPAPNKTQGTVPTGHFQTPPGKQIPAYSKQSPPQGQDVYQVPAGPANLPQDIYQVPPAPAGLGQDVYQVPPSLDGRVWDTPKPQGKLKHQHLSGSNKQERAEEEEQLQLPDLEVDLQRASLAEQSIIRKELLQAGPGPGGGPNTWGQVYVYESPKENRMSMTLPPATSKKSTTPRQHGGLLTNQCSQEADSKGKRTSIAGVSESKYLHIFLLLPPEPYLPEDVYDVPPAANKSVCLKPRRSSCATWLEKDGQPGSSTTSHEKCLSAARTGKAIISMTCSPRWTGRARLNDDKASRPLAQVAPRSNLSSSLLWTWCLSRRPRIRSCTSTAVAMETLARLQNNVSAAVSYLMSFISCTWRSLGADGGAAA